MQRLLAPAFAGLLLAGCALPPAVQITSFLVDVVTFAASGKTTTDHAISMARDEDCALYRIVKGEPVCQDSQIVDDPKGSDQTATK